MKLLARTPIIGICTLAAVTTAAAQGNKTGNRIVFKHDGKDYPIAALDQKAYATIAFTVKSKKPFAADYVTKADGKVTTTATEGLSADGKTYTVTTRATN
jgi:hypothetical protein